MAITLRLILTSLEDEPSHEDVSMILAFQIYDRTFMLLARHLDEAAERDDVDAPMPNLLVKLRPPSRCSDQVVRLELLRTHDERSPVRLLLRGVVHMEQRVDLILDTSALDGEALEQLRDNLREELSGSIVGTQFVNLREEQGSDAGADGSPRSIEVERCDAIYSAADALRAVVSQAWSFGRLVHGLKEARRTVQRALDVLSHRSDGVAGSFDWSLVRQPAHNPQYLECIMSQEVEWQQYVVERSVQGAWHAASKRIQAATCEARCVTCCRRALARAYVSAVLTMAALAAWWARTHLGIARALGRLDWPLSAPSRAVGGVLRRAAAAGLAAASRHATAGPDARSRILDPEWGPTNLVAEVVLQLGLHLFRICLDLLRASLYVLWHVPTLVRLFMRLALLIALYAFVLRRPTEALIAALGPPVSPPPPPAPARPPEKPGPPPFPAPPPFPPLLPHQAWGYQIKWTVLLAQPWTGDAEARLAAVVRLACPLPPPPPSPPSALLSAPLAEIMPEIMSSAETGGLGTSWRWLVGQHDALLRLSETFLETLSPRLDTCEGMRLDVQVDEALDGTTSTVLTVSADPGTKAPAMVAAQILARLSRDPLGASLALHEPVLNATMPELRMLRLGAPSPPPTPPPAPPPPTPTSSP